MQLLVGTLSACWAQLAVSDSLVCKRCSKHNCIEPTCCVTNLLEHKQEFRSLQVGKLSACPALLRLDLSGNQLTSLAGLETCLQLKWLSASGNPLTDVSALEALSNLRVQHIAAPSTTQPSACTR